MAKDNVHTYNGILLRHKEKLAFEITIQTEGAGNDHCEWSVPDTEK